MADPSGPYPNAYPTIGDLLAGMRTPNNHLGATEGWDMVVSYSLDNLNELLGRLWSDHPTTGASISIISDNVNEDDEVYHILWTLQLGIPSLQFTYDSRAELTMKLSGTWQTQNDPNKAAHPVKNIPENAYFLVATVPLDFVLVSTTGPDTVTRPKTQSGTYVSFGDDPNAAFHVVFDFQNTSARGATFRIDSSSKEPPPDIFGSSLAPKLAAWMSDPKSIKAIDYSLAVIQNKPLPEVAYLVPKDVALSIYARQDQDKVGCLSVYINTQASGNQPGKAIRTFELPKDNRTMYTYPIPDGYTASIIIRHDLFADNFLKSSLLRANSVDGTNTKVFRDVTLRGDNTVGFALDIAINSRSMADFSRSPIMGGDYNVDKIDWDFGRDPLTLVIDENANAVWNYHFHDNVSWSEWPIGDAPPYDGKVEYDLSLSKSGSLLSQTNDTGLVVKVELTSSDWHASIYASKSEMQPDIRDGLNTFQLPTCRNDLRLDYFAATNLFGPGKHMISVDDKHPIYTPFDVIILGHVIVPVGSTTQAPVAGPTKTAHIDSVDIDDAADNDALTTGSATGSTADFVSALSYSKPILAQAVAALQSGDEKTIDDFLANSGYNITAEGLQAALKTAQPGPGFDIRNAGGAYTFTEPVDMSSTSMTIDPTTGRLYVGGIYAGNSTDDRGHVVWEMDNFHHNVQFDVSFNNDGLPNTVTFSGTRSPVQDKDPGSKDSTRVSGQQVTNADPATFPDDKGSATAAWVLGIIGLSFTFLSFAYEQYRERKKDNLKKQADRIRNGISKVDAAIDKEAASAAEDRFKNLNLADFRMQIETEVRNTVKASMDAKKSEDDVSKDAAAAAKEKFKNLSTELLRSDVTSKLGRFKNVVGSFVVSRSATRAIGAEVDAKSSRFNIDGSYMTAITGAEIAKYRLDAKMTAAKQIPVDLRNAEAASNEEFQKVSQKQKEQSEYALSQKEKGATEESLENDEQYKSLSDEINKLMEGYSAAENELAKIKTQSDNSEKESRELMDEEQHARSHANDIAEETFKGRP